jgi:cyclopropane fatty-acyl-phospholipid synthase-like methyltransferase
VSDVEDLYERYAREWDNDRGGELTIERAWIDRFISLLPEGSSILDFGCGSGQPIARYLIDHGFTVTGVDSSPSLISLCRARFPDQEWIVADMRTVSLDRKFQGLIAWDSFFHLGHEQQREMFLVFNQHAATGAVLLFTSGTHHGEAIGSYRGEQLYHASLAPAEYRSLLAANGFRVIAYEADDPDCGHHTVWLAQAEAALK